MFETRRAKLDYRLRLPKLHEFYFVQDGRAGHIGPAGV